MVDFGKLLSEGSVEMTGGCVAPLSLRITFNPAGEKVVLFIENRWLQPPGFFVSKGTIDRTRFIAFVETLRIAASAPAVHTIGSTGAASIVFRFPFADKTVEGCGYEGGLSPPPGPMMAPAFELAKESFSDPNFTVEHMPHTYVDVPSISLWRAILIVVVVGVLLYLLVVYFLTTG
jgi:hypothetical protein